MGFVTFVEGPLLKIVFLAFFMGLIRAVPDTVSHVRN
jgi:hypothetical protein